MAEALLLEGYCAKFDKRNNSAYPAGTVANLEALTGRLKAVCRS